jgi:type III pantothenate kinase
MLLAVNVGNTHTKFGLYAGAARRAGWRATTARAATADEWGAGLATALAVRGLALPAVRACIIASVVPPVTTALAAMSAGWLGTPALVVGPDLRLGIRLGVENPQAIGADRVVNGAAAFARYGGPCIVVDLGTASTVNAVDAAGTLLGGAIAPGLNTAAGELYRRTAGLAVVDPVVPRRVIGTSTERALQAGIVLGHLGPVEGLVARMQAELRAGGATGPIPVIATGGLARLLAPATTVFTHIDPDLTLDGLPMIYALNAPPGAPAADK